MPEALELPLPLELLVALEPLVPPAPPAPLELLVALALLVALELLAEPPPPVVLELPNTSDPEPQPIEVKTIDPMTTTASDASFDMRTSKE